MKSTYIETLTTILEKLNDFSQNYYETINFKIENELENDIIHIKFDDVELAKDFKSINGIKEKNIEFFSDESYISFDLNKF